MSLGEVCDGIAPYSNIAGSLFARGRIYCEISTVFLSRQGLLGFEISDLELVVNHAHSAEKASNARNTQIYAHAHQ